MQLLGQQFVGALQLEVTHQEAFDAFGDLFDVVLVLHGSSGIPHDMVREAIRNGIAKVNLATEIKDTFMRALKQTLQNSDEIDLRKVFPKATDSVVELLCDKYKMEGSATE